VIKEAIVLIVLMAAAPAHAGLTNLPSNPGFETGALAPWFQSRDASSSGVVEPWTVTPIDAHSGRFSAEVINDLELRQNFAPTPVAAIKQLSFWLEHPNASQAPASVSFFYADGIEGFSAAVTQTTGWEFFNLTADLTPGETLTGLSIFGYAGDPVSLTRVDDVKLLVASVPEPATAVMFGLSLATLVVTRRRAVKSRDH